MQSEARPDVVFHSNSSRKRLESDLSFCISNAKCPLVMELFLLFADRHSSEIDGTTRLAV